MVKTNEDGIYIRLAGNINNGEAFTEHWANVYPFNQNIPSYDKLKSINEVLVNALKHIRQATNNSTIVILANEALELAQQQQ